MRLVSPATVSRLALGMMVACSMLALVVRQSASSPPASAQSAPPAGLELLNNLQDLPHLRPDAHTYQVSSHDKTGGGFDGSHVPDDGLESYLRIEGGEYVILDEVGPGAVTRMWFTWSILDPQFASRQIKFYFDGEPSPRIDMTLGEMFSGTTSPFVFPLAGGESASSGGYYSYVPIPFAQSLKVTLSGSPPFYNLTYEKYDADASVTSYTGSEDVSGVIAKLLAPGTDPKPSGNNVVENGTIAIPAGGQAQIFQRSGPGTINAIKISIPQIVPAPLQNEIEDDGRVFNGFSSFTVNIDPSNTGVRLTRRFDYSMPGQSAQVYVDGSLAGTWTNGGMDPNDRWRDSDFEIPSALTAGKSQLQIEVHDALGGSDWTEYLYTVTSHAGGDDVATDTLDIGNEADEAVHNYQVVGQTAETLVWGTYPAQGDPVAQQQSRDVLTQTRLLASWDGEAIPSVDAPLGALFGSWAGESDVRSLMTGMDPDGTYYIYYPMPFASSAAITIRNDSAIAITSLSYEIEYDPSLYTGLGVTAGYFRATTNQETPTLDGRDYTALDVERRGQVVGLVLLTRSLPGTPAGGERAHLEGDERIYMDGDLSPALYGTGTEDFFNGGWYFRRGVFSQSMHGAPTHTDPIEGGARLDEVGAYRLFLTDALSFRSSIKLGLEHGTPAGYENLPWNANYYTLVFWYGLTEPASRRSDMLDVGNQLSQQQHQYTAQGASAATFDSFFYEGDADNMPVSDDGHTATGAVQFTVAIRPDNQGLVLRRRADQSARDQRAIVSIDSVPVGTWFDAGRNVSKRWRDSEFLVPASATAGKSYVVVTLTPQGGVPWSAYRYWVFSILPAAVKSDNGDTDSDTIPNSIDLDDDDDGCADVRELGSMPVNGGRRDPHSVWDFFDTPKPNTVPLRDKVVDLNDILRVAVRFATTGSPAVDPLSPPPPAGYHTAYDRSGQAGLDRWDLGPADGAIGLSDIFDAAAQSAHNCT